MNNIQLKSTEHIKVIFTAVPILMQLLGAELKVLVCCWKAATHSNRHTKDGNIISNNPVFKKLCAEEGLDMSDGAIDNAISGLCKKGLLIRQCRGQYSLNPNYFIK